MIKKVPVLFFMLAAFSLTAQEVISTQGDSYTNSNGTIDFTIGETVINTFTNGNTTLTQGFHQPNNFTPIDCDLSLSGTTTTATLGFANGSATVIVSGGTAPFQFSWNDSFQQTEATALGLFPGTYVCTVTDAHNCIETIELIVPLESDLPLTQLRPQFCNTTGYNLNNVISCNSVPGASNYRWQFTPQGGSPLPEFTRGSSNYNLRLGWVTGIALGVTYEVRVKAFINGEWAEYGPMCTITTTSVVQLTEVHPNYAPNNPNTNAPYQMCGVIAALNVAGATIYEWELTGINTLFVQTSSYNLILSSVPGLLMSSSYQVRVRAQVSGFWGEFGPARTVEMGPPATTNIFITHCNTTRTLSQHIGAYSVCGGPYFFRFQHPSEPDRIVMRPSYSCGLNLPMPALTPGETYMVSVRVTQGGIEGEYGAACPITIAGPETEGLSSEFSANKSLETEDFYVYPNPTADVLNIFAETYESVTYTLYDVKGKLILNESLTQEQTLLHLHDLSTGIYTLTLRNRNEFLKTFKIVKTH